MMLHGPLHAPLLIEYHECTAQLVSIKLEQICTNAALHSLTAAESVEWRDNVIKRCKHAGVVYYNYSRHEFALLAKVINPLIIHICAHGVQNLRA
jgi:hypothetical protein